MMKKIVLMSTVLALAATAGCKKKKDDGAGEAPKTQPAPPAATGATGAPAATGMAAATGGTGAMAATGATGATGAEPAKVDWEAGQSTGAQTELIESKDKANPKMHTLVDREIGVQITCPPDKTWTCKLGPDKKFDMSDMSGYSLVVRVAKGADLSAALSSEIEYVKSKLPVKNVGEAKDGGVTLDVDVDPAWATPTPRKAWIQVKDIGGKFFACEGTGAAPDWDNAAGDMKTMCDSMAAPAAAK